MIMPTTTNLAFQLQYRYWSNGMQGI